MSGYQGPPQPAYQHDPANPYGPADGQHQPSYQDNGGYDYTNGQSTISLPLSPLSFARGTRGLGRDSDERWRGDDGRAPVFLRGDDMALAAYRSLEGRSKRSILSPVVRWVASRPGGEGGLGREGHGL